MAVDAGRAPDSFGNWNARYAKEQGHAQKTNGLLFLSQTLVAHVRNFMMSSAAPTTEHAQGEGDGQYAVAVGTNAVREQGAHCQGQVGENRRGDGPPW